MSFGDPDNGPVTVEIASQLSNGAKCDGPTAGGGASLLLRVTDLAAGDTSTVRGLIILQGFYSPQMPDGDHEALSRIQGALTDVTCWDGPGSYLGFFHLDGTRVRHHGLAELGRPTRPCSP